MRRNAGEKSVVRLQTVSQSRSRRQVSRCVDSRKDNLKKYYKNKLFMKYCYRRNYNANCMAKSCQLVQYLQSKESNSSKSEPRDKKKNQYFLTSNNRKTGPQQQRENKHG